ncbi:PDR/VanB family oxidoreductase [Comamonas thiooxydans]|uniref:PDR/VanB family oxidoreductase n=1 Tax=Comamonas thiooxydans TaxID=363952 RepID=UPI001CCEFA28|nr:PDR/VanB family oxidoreductase [Comamonas thiooxydans]UBQ41336.1 PDR/VanB family oxidoreductase [Comamonas thiooxydans]
MKTETTFEVRIAHKQEQAAGICSLELRALEGASLAPFSAGSHIDVHLPGGLVRQYSLSNDPAELDRYVIAVLREPASRGGSAAVHEQLQAGQQITISHPRNHFELHAPARKHLLLAGGIGITPILAMARKLAHDGAEFALHYCGRSRERMAFAQTIETAQWADKAQIHVDDANGKSSLGLSELLQQREQGQHLYVCGPKGFMDAVLDTAREAGWPAEQLHYEFFAAEVEHRADDESFEVEVASSGQVVRVTPAQTVVQALESIGVCVQTSCEQGVCGTCLTRVISGQPDHRDMYLTEDEQAANDQFLPCCSRARSGRLVLDL